MAKLYAIIHPAFNRAGDNITDIPSLLFAPLHYVLYEQVCGYSLGHDVHFFDELIDAKNCFDSADWRDNPGILRVTTASAIIELEVDEGHIMNVNAIMTASFEKGFVPTQSNSQFFKSVEVISWAMSKIQSGDLTSGAIGEINRQYQIWSHLQTGSSMSNSQHLPSAL